MNAPNEGITRGHHIPSEAAETAQGVRFISRLRAASAWITSTVVQVALRGAFDALFGPYLIAAFRYC